MIGAPWQWQEPWYTIGVFGTALAIFGVAVLIVVAAYWWRP